MPIRLVLFDMDDVVYAYARAARIAVIARETGLDPKDIEARIWTSGFQDDADAGLYPTVEAYLAGWEARLGGPMPRELWVRARAASLTPIEETLSLIHRLARSDVAIGVLTNNGPLLHAEREALVPELSAIAAERFLVSAAFGTRKPDPAVFTRALDRLGFAADETVFVDDRIENVAGAATAGLAAIHFQAPHDLAPSLRALGLPV